MGFPEGYAVAGEMIGGVGGESEIGDSHFRQPGFVESRGA